MSDRDLADLDARQDEICNVLVGVPVRDALKILSWVAAGALHQAVQEKDDATRAAGLALAASQFFGQLIEAINKITEEVNEETEKEEGAPAGVTVQ
jgi:hypothetical protein